MKEFTEALKAHLRQKLDALPEYDEHWLHSSIDDFAREWASSPESLANYPAPDAPNIPAGVTPARQARLILRQDGYLMGGGMQDANRLDASLTAPSFDEAEFAELTRKGREAWADVPNATDFVEELRGNKIDTSPAALRALADNQDLTASIWTGIVESTLHAVADEKEKQDVPQGWKLFALEGFADLLSSLERAESKGYMPDAISKAWSAFDYRSLADGQAT